MDTDDKIITFPGTHESIPVTQADVLQALQFLTEEVTAINQTLLQLVRVLKENS